MESSQKRVSWRVDTEGLPTGPARALQKAVSSVSYWLEKWEPLIVATVPTPVQFTVAGLDGPDYRSVVDSGSDGCLHFRITAPRELILGEAEELQFDLLEHMLEAVESAGRELSQPVQVEVWRPQQDPECASLPWVTAMVQALEPDEVFIAGRLDGSDVDGLSRFHELDEYLNDRVSRTGFGEVIDTESGCSDVSWTLRLNCSANIDD